MKLKQVLSKIALVGLLANVLLPLVANASAQITTRSLTLGTSQITTSTTHKLDFTLPTTGNVGSIQFLYCTTASGACVTPTGLVTTTATLTAQSGASGFTINAATAGSPYITRASALVTAPLTVSYTLSNVTNPSTQNTTFYVRISSYVATDTTGTAVDAGVVAASTAQQILLSGTMPESLVFCVGTSGTNCTNIVGSAINFGFFSPASTVSATSVMAASTNANLGYSITVSGATLTSGINTIPALAAQTASVVGTSQFGTNLKSNATPTVGANPAGGSGAASANYATADQFRFVSGDTVASSGTSSANTLYQNSYVVNVGGNQTAGVYTATMTYICTATF